MMRQTLITFASMLTFLCPNLAHAAASVSLPNNTFGMVVGLAIMAWQTKIHFVDDKWPSQPSVNRWGIALVIVFAIMGVAVVGYGIYGRL